MLGDFTACEICGSENWCTVYQGAVRDGAFGTLHEGATVARCDGCGVDRLAEHICPDDSFYETEAYRRKLGQDLSTGAYLAAAKELQSFALAAIEPALLKNKTVADVGCAGGSFLDHIARVTNRKVAIEPSSIYRDSLTDRGFAVFPYATDAAAEFGGKVDFATSFQVIEHVRDPRDFLARIRPLLAPGGSLLITTPNRRDILMELLPDDFPAFFYRVVHRWYFDEDSLANCARRAGFVVDSVRFVHRYGLSNALTWLRDRRPSGRTRLAGIESPADDCWRGYLEDGGRADCIFMFLKADPAA
jgi:SAM-dependent methyltransferase